MWHFTKLSPIFDLSPPTPKIYSKKFACRSSSQSAPRTVRATIGDRAFPAAAASVWNSLPETPTFIAVIASFPQ